MKILRSFSDLQYKRFNTQNSTILIIAAERYDIGHAMQIADTLRVMRPNCILTQLQPDHPMFIQSKNGFMWSWKEFAEGKGGSFLVKPRPEMLNQILLNEENIGKFLRSSILNTKEFCYSSSNIIYSKHPSLFAEVRASDFQGDGFMTGLLYHGNNPSVVSCSLIGDMPELIYRDQVARQIDLKTLSEYYFQFTEELEDRNSSFDFRRLDPDLMLRPKAAYVCELLKQISVSHNLISAIVDINILPYLEEEWVKLEENPADLKTFLGIQEPKEECSMLDYVEKHVLLEIMLGLFIRPYYMKFGVFPYTGVGMLGYDDGIYLKSIEAWKYYYETHANKLKNLINRLIAGGHSHGKDDVVHKKNMNDQERQNYRKMKKKTGYKPAEDSS